MERLRLNLNSMYRGQLTDNELKDACENLLQFFQLLIEADRHQITK
jgi:hypothetical protein